MALQPTPVAPSTEVERIRQAYRKRLGSRPVSFYSPANVFSNQEMERHFLKFLRRLSLVPLDDLRLLDVGCAGGFFLRSLLKYGARSSNLFGVDIWEERLVEGHQIVPTLGLSRASAHQLPFADELFDIVVQTTMLSSVLDEMLRFSIAREMMRVLRRGGYIFSYDFRYRRPGDKDVCPIRLRHLTELFPSTRMVAELCTLPPPITRVLAQRSQAVCQLVSSLWPFKSHYWAAVSKP